MGTGKTLEPCLFFIDLGVVLHGARAQWVHAGVYTEVPLG